MTNSEAKRKANKKWYEENKQKHYECCISHIKKYHEENKKKILEKMRNKYRLDKEFLILRNIDLF